MIGDTHSRVAAPQLNVIPIELKWFGDEMHITRAASDFRDLLGARVIQIGAIPPPKALRRVVPLIAQNVNGSFARLLRSELLEEGASDVRIRRETARTRGRSAQASPGVLPCLSGASLRIPTWLAGAPGHMLIKARKLRHRPVNS